MVRGVVLGVVLQHALVMSDVQERTVALALLLGVALGTLVGFELNGRWWHVCCFMPHLSHTVTSRHGVVVGAGKVYQAGAAVVLFPLLHPRLELSFVLVVRIALDDDLVFIATVGEPLLVRFVLGVAQQHPTIHG